VAEYLARFGIDGQRITQSLSSAAVDKSLYRVASTTIGQDAFRFSVLFFLMLYLLFFFLRDGHRLIAAMMYALPLAASANTICSKSSPSLTSHDEGHIRRWVVQGTLGVSSSGYWAQGSRILGRHR
jgi:hypothetical protein